MPMRVAKKNTGLFNILKSIRRNKTMSKSNAWFFTSLLVILPFFPDAVTAAYKCVDSNGDVTYSQTPCRKNQKTDKQLKSSNKPVETENCKYAGAFSKLAFRHMRSGLSTQQLFDRYGGVSSISQGTLGVINYVYSFKYSEAMQPDRIAQLTIARCKAQAFGKVLCEDFPQEFQEMIFSCDDEERKEAIRLQKLVEQGMGAKRQFNNSATVNAYGSKDRETRSQEWLEAQERKNKEKEQARIIKCKKRYESKIKEIDQRMSRGYTVSLGETLRDRRRSLVQELATECQ